MIAVCLLVSNMIPQETSISFDKKARSFVVKVGKETRVAKVQPAPPEPIPALVFRKDDRWVVWDDRGLVIRVGDKVTTTKLDPVVDDATLFTAKQKAENGKLIKEGKRKKQAAALSGAVRIGSTVFLLPRWVDNTGQTWLEAMVKVDFSDPEPRPKVLGKFNGNTRATKNIDNEVFVVDDRPAAIVTQGDTWGVSSLDPKSGDIVYSVFGSNLVEYRSSGLFLEKTSYKTTLFGEVDPKTGRRRILYETKSTNFELTPTLPVLARFDSKATVFHHLETGAEVSLPGKQGFREAGDWLVAWKTDNGRTRVNVYKAETWALLASANISLK